MPLRKLYKDNYSLGYNSRDFPTEIPFESCQTLYNARPGTTVLVPRDGIDKWNSDAENWGFTFDEIIPWSEDDEEIIIISGKSFYSASKSSPTPTLLKTVSVADGTKFSWVRVQTALYIITNKQANNASFIISKDADGFVFRNGNIALPDHGIVAVDAGPGGQISADKFIGILATIVRRTDSQGLDAYGNPVLCTVASASNNFNPGKLESIGDLDKVETFQAVGADSNADVTITLAEVPDEQATHLRIYRTLEADDADTVLGLAFRWERDIPLVTGQLVYTYNENLSNETMAGSLNQWKTVGYEPFPAGSFITHHKGHLWIGGVVTDEDFPDHRGRWYYSQTIQDADFPDKWYSMWNTTMNFKDTSLDDQEDGSCAGVHDDDLVLINTKNTVWKIRHGDITLEPELISSTKGSIFSRSIIKIDEMLMYLSNEGPAYLEGDQVNTMREFTAGEVWPELWDGTPGYFFKDIDPLSVRSFYFRHNWWICRDGMFVAMFIPTKQQGFGPWRVVPAWSQIRADAIAVLGYNKCVLASNHHEGSFLWNFLNPDVKTDNGIIFKIESMSKAFYVNKINPDLAAELYDILVHTRFTDAGRFNLKVIADRYRMLFSRDYKQSEFGVVTAENIDNPRRNVLQQGFEEGLIGRVFEVEWMKEFRPPWDFEMKGFALQHMIMPEHEFEYQAMDMTEYISDALTTARDISDWIRLGKIKDAGDAATRVLANYTVRDAGEAELRRFGIDGLNYAFDARDAGRSIEEWELIDAGDETRVREDYGHRDADDAEDRLSKLTEESNP